jgi:hypothetical protein
LRIDKNHLYHGSALLQIAEDPHFKAINPILMKGGPARSAYEIFGQGKARSAVYLKFAAKPTPAHGEYVFNFNNAQLDELEAIAEVVPRVFLALICVEARHICCLAYERLLMLVAERRKRKGSPESTYTVLVTARPNKAFRVYMNVPGKKNLQFGELTVSRNDFPSVIFN